ncbi:unnamed protein product [Cochlearia groenlandica]
MLCILIVHLHVISGLNSTIRISSLSGGPAFVGQVLSMCDLTGTDLMDVSTHFDILFISKRCNRLDQFLPCVFMFDSLGMGRFEFFMEQQLRTPRQELSHALYQVNPFFSKVNPFFSKKLVGAMHYNKMAYLPRLN